MSVLCPPYSEPCCISHSLWLLYYCNIFAQSSWLHSARAVERVNDGLGWKGYGAEADRKISTPQGPSFICQGHPAQIYILFLVVYRSFCGCQMFVHLTEISLCSVTGFTCNTSMNFGYFPDPVSCSYFYRCVYGIAYHFTCPTGTLWDDAVLTCNYPYGLSVARRLQCQLA